MQIVGSQKKKNASYRDLLATPAMLLSFNVSQQLLSEASVGVCVGAWSQKKRGNIYWDFLAAASSKFTTSEHPLSEASVWGVSPSRSWRAVLAPAFSSNATTVGWQFWHASMRAV